MGAPDDRVGILLADDRAEDLLVLTSVLAAPQLELVTATTGAEALRYLLERDFAVIVLDIVMPGMDGFELAALIRGRKRSAQTPILFLTGVESDSGFLHKAYALGAVDYLQKPVDADILRAKVGVFVQLFEKDRRIREQAQALLDAAKRNRELELEQIRLESLRRYRNLADAIPQIVGTTNARGELAYLNRRWYEYTGLKEDDPAIRSWAEALHPDDLGGFARAWQRAVSAREPFEINCRVRAADGSYRWHLCQSRPERHESGDLLGWLGTLTDLDDVLRAHRNAESAIHARDEFLSVASHELRTPLSALLVQLGSLARTLSESGFGDTNEHKARKKVAAALRHTTRLSKLVDNLLDISRLATQRLQLEPEELELSDLVREVVDRFGEEARQVGCELRISALGGCYGSWDRLRVEQIVTNLLSNALKYGRGNPVEVAVESDESVARLRVRDFGIGISNDDHARIFDRFERAVPVQHYGGMGLGLYITRKIVTAHGGKIDVASRVGSGATFTVELPRHVEPARQVRPRMKEEAR